MARYPRRPSQERETIKGSALRRLGQRIWAPASGQRVRTDTMPTNLVRNLRVAWKAPRWRWALLIAGASDAVGFGLALFPPGQWLVDAATAAALFAVLGFRWSLLTALAIEAVPVLQLFPAWTLAVVALAALDSEKSTAGLLEDGSAVRLVGANHRREAESRRPPRNASRVSRRPRRCGRPPPGSALTGGRRAGAIARA